MALRILEYTGKFSATCNKPNCGKVVEVDPEKFKEGSPCPAVREVPPRAGVEEKAASIPCEGTLLADPIGLRRGGKTYTFDPKVSIVVNGTTIPCNGRRVAVVEDIAPDDNNIAEFTRLHDSPNNGYFWATDLEQMLKDVDVLGAVERNAEKIRLILGISRGPGRSRTRDDE